MNRFKILERYVRRIIAEAVSRRFIAYHSTDYDIDTFDFDKIETKSGSSTRIDGIFFSDTPQKSWGDNIYKVELISTNPAFFDLSNSRFDSMGVQEAFDALLRGDGSYIIEDLVEYAGMEYDEAENLVDGWADLDLIVLTGVNYAKHNIEYIVPQNARTPADIINLGKVTN